MRQSVTILALVVLVSPATEAFFKHIPADEQQAIEAAAKEAEAVVVHEQGKHPAAAESKPMEDVPVTTSLLAMRKMPEPEDYRESVSEKSAYRAQVEPPGSGGPHSLAAVLSDGVPPQIPVAAGAVDSLIEESGQRLWELKAGETLRDAIKRWAGEDFRLVWDVRNDKGERVRFRIPADYSIEADNIRDALRQVVDAYIQAGGAIPAFRIYRNQVIRACLVGGSCAK